MQVTKLKRMKKFKNVFAGVTVGSSYLQVSSKTIKTDGAYLDKLIILIDNKGIFYDQMANERPERFVDSVKEVRTLANATESLVESQEAADIAFNIADACRVFMRDFDVTMNPSVWQGVLTALRAQVSRYVSLAVVAFDVPAPRNFKLKPSGDWVQQKLLEWRNHP